MKECFVTVCLWAAVAIVVVPSYAQRPAQSPSKKAEPAPKRDLSGYWLGNAVVRLEAAPPMTPEGQKFFDGAKPLQGPRAVAIAKTTDPLVTCDPLGFPRNVLYELRGVAFEQVPRKTLQLFQYQ